MLKSTVDKISITGDAVIDVSAVGANAGRGRITIESEDAVFVMSDSIIKANASEDSDAGYIDIHGHGRGSVIADNARLEAKGAAGNSAAGRIFLNSYHDVDTAQVVNGRIVDPEGRISNYKQGAQGQIRGKAYIDASGGKTKGGWIDLNSSSIRIHCSRVCDLRLTIINLTR
jgi:hypothetical protein